MEISSLTLNNDSKAGIDKLLINVFSFNKNIGKVAIVLIGFYGTNENRADSAWHYLLIEESVLQA